MSAAEQRELARSLFMQALAATTVPAAFARHLRADDTALHAGDRSYHLSRHDEVIVLALGKAGATMFDAFDALLPNALRRRAVVSAPFPPQRKSSGVQFFAGGHPEPSQASFDAAQAALGLLADAAANALVVFLISGGASAMFELPIDPRVALADVIMLNRLLVGSGASITGINAVRKHLSRVKGGRLALAAGTREKLTLLVSDVPDGALDALGSGPSLPDSTTSADCRELLERHSLLEQLPEAWRIAMHDGIAETPKPGNPAFTHAQALTLLDNAAMLEEAARRAQAHGYHVVIDNSCDDWDYNDAARYLLDRMRALQAQHGGKLCLLSGGEVTVKLPASPGSGGRNQQFALACVAAGIADGVTVLSAGTDGIDGNSPAAGVVADASTRSRAEAAGLAVEEHLSGFNAYPLFAQLGDAIVSGPTGNNLRDVRMLLSAG